MYIYTLINRLVYTHIKAYTYIYIPVMYIYTHIYAHKHPISKFLSTSPVGHHMVLGDDFGTFQRSKFGCVLPDLEQFMSDWLISSDLTMGSISFWDAPLNETTLNPQS
jgi:hypothetical protein